MEIRELDRALQIRYVKLHFGIRFRETVKLPMNKVSAIRGGIGEMLLCANCIRDRRCAGCDFEQECIVRRIMYSGFERKPAFVTSGESAGYVLECENYREWFEAGDTLDFQLVLFGKTIVYFSQLLQAIYQLGQAGLGKEHARYDLISIRGTRGRQLLQGQNIRMEAYEIRTVGAYAAYRLEQKTKWENRIRFKTPVTLKKQGQYQERLTMEAVIPALLRRIYMLDCFEGIQCGELRWSKVEPKTLEENSRKITVYRYSGTQDRKIALWGVKGDLLASEIPRELLLALLAGEVLHIGKNTSFGFGRYRVW